MDAFVQILDLSVMSLVNKSGQKDMDVHTPVSMVCANISRPSRGAGGSSDASGGSFRHSWASCMLEVIHEDQPWESQLPPVITNHM